MHKAIEKSDVIKILSGISIFKGLDLASLEKIYILFKEKFFQKDQIIIKEGSNGDSMMIIISGEARVTQVIDSAEEEALVVLKQGEAFGEMALLEKLPRSATVIAQKDILLLEIDRTDFLDFVHTNPKSGNVILLNMAKILSARLRETDTKLKTFINLSKWI